jgi:UDP-2-acetamido-3-amino-2,3-dideoxy-glucuronate N-acetyltransferase
MQTRQIELEAFEGRVRLVRLHEVSEQRGKLVEIDYSAPPFVPCRSFIVGDIPDGLSRGGHAHESCEQLLGCLQDWLEIELSYRRRRTKGTLNDKAVGLYIAAKIWARQTYFENAKLLVLASLPYDLDSYIERFVAVSRRSIRGWRSSNMECAWIGAPTSTPFGAC